MDTVKITTTNAWGEVGQIDITDRVLGGESGAINIQAKQLANRDGYLKNIVDNLSQPPYFTVKIVPGVSFTTPSQFSSYPVSYRLPSYGRIAFSVEELGGGWGTHSQFFEMKFYSPNTTPFPIAYSRDDGGQVYFNSAFVPLTGAASYAGPTQATITPVIGSNLLQICYQSDGSGGMYQDYLYFTGDIITPTRTFIAPTV